MWISTHSAHYCTGTTQTYKLHHVGHGCNTSKPTWSTGCAVCQSICPDPTGVKREILPSHRNTWTCGLVIVWSNWEVPKHWEVKSEMWLWKASKSSRSDCRGDFLSLTAFTSPAGLHWISWVQHKNKTQALISSPAVGFLQGHSQEQQMLCGSQVSSAGSSQGSSRALYCLDSDCGIAALCSLWAVTRVL